MKWMFPTLLSLMVLIGGAQAHVQIHVIEYGAKSDGHGQILADVLDPRNTPSTLAVTNDGAIWFRENFAWHPRIARFAKDGTFNEYQDPYVDPTNNPCKMREACDPLDWSAGFTPLVADGNRVLVGPIQRNPARVVTLSPDGSVGTRGAAGCLAAGPNIACFARSKVLIKFRQITRSFRSAPEPSVWPNSAVLGPNDEIWFTDTAHSLLGRIRPNGEYSTFTQGLTRWNSGPQFITVGPDNNLWFTELRDRIGRMTLDGKITEFSQGIPKRSSLGGIASGPDGTLWFTLYHGMVLGNITLTGHISLYHDLVYPSDGHDFDPVAMIVPDAMGNLYYNEGQAGRIARVTISP